MTRYPGAIWKPINRNYTARKRARTDCVILHIAVSEAASLHGWFDNPEAGSSSHLYVRRNGTTEQYLDMDYISWANGDGNSRSITVETQGLEHGTWTSQQVTKLAEICRWANAQYGVPLQLMPDSKPSTRGVGYHRLGCDPYRAPGGEKWSKAYGKSCPGPDRIPQIPSIIATAKGGITPASATTTPQEDDVTPEQMTELKDHITAELNRMVGSSHTRAGISYAPIGYNGETVGDMANKGVTGAQAAYSNTVVLKGQIQALIDAVGELAANPSPVDAEALAGMLQRIEDRAVDAIAGDYELTKKEDETVG
jgi:hypothetical protein